MKPSPHRPPRRSPFGGLSAAFVTAALLAVLLGIAAPPRAVAAAPDVQARSGILIRSDTGTVLWSKSPDRRLAAGVVHQDHDGAARPRALQRPRPLCARARQREDQQKVAIGLRPGDRITVRQALRAMLVKSANDATVTLAVGVAGSERAFVRR